jgi:hypothetical protein
MITQRDLIKVSADGSVLTSFASMAEAVIAMETIVPDKKK